jgi:beta-glucosidase
MPIPNRLAAGLALLAAAAAPAAACPAIPPRNPPPFEAQPQAHPDAGWASFVQRLEAGLRQQPPGPLDVVFLGDSLTFAWDREVFLRHFARYRTLNLGIPGDMTQTLLFRLPRQWTGLNPSVVVLLIGTNNAWSNRPADNALGIAEVIRFIQSHAPNARILLLGLLPRGAGASDPARQVNLQVNQLISRCADGGRVIYLDVGATLLERDGRLSRGIAPDQLHFTAAGYERISAAIAPVLRGMLGW